MLTICALFYGDHAALAARCLGGLDDNLAAGRPFIGDIRLGLNEVSRGVTDYILGWAEEAAIRHSLPILVYRPDCNAFKYPLMRRMIHGEVHGHPLGDLVMWQDDDAHLEQGFDWKHMLDFMARQDMIGHIYYWYVQGAQAEWVKRQPWHDPRVDGTETRNGRPVFLFAQGSWWVIRSEILQRYDWPIRELKHNGGDALLGELFRQQGLRLANYSHRVRVNADEEGRDSKAKRRGFSELPLGVNLAASFNKDLSYHNFAVNLRVFTVDGWSETSLQT